MKRISHKKVIHYTSKHEELKNKYTKMLKRLSLAFVVEENALYKDLVNFKLNKSIPIHSWFDYKQGYAAELVNKLIQDSKIKSKGYILDPFNGVGTTLLAAQSQNIQGIGLDINPVATFVSKVKTYRYSEEDIKDIKKTISQFKSSPLKISAAIPEYLQKNKIFDADTLDKILRIKGFYETIKNGIVRDFFKLAHLSIIERCSDRVKDGNGIKISRTKKKVDALEFFLETIEKMCADIVLTSNNTEAIVIQGSILQDSVYKSLKKKKIVSTIFSPPYANCFDYCEVYKMEIWLGDFVSSYEDFATYRNLAIRSHVNSKFSHKISNPNEDIKVTAELISTFNIWNKKIPAMLEGYFDDMYITLKRVYDLSSAGAKCIIVVANSSYKGIVVPTDLLLASIGKKVGFKFEKIAVARKIRSSSQQMKELHAGGLMRESIIFLRK